MNGNRAAPPCGTSAMYGNQRNGTGGGTGHRGWVFLAVAAVLLLALAAAQGYVSWRAQYAFVNKVKHASAPAMLEALGLDAGAVIFALLGLAHTRMERPALVERVLNTACAGGSLTMNVLGANLGSPRSVAVYVLPAVLYVACSDRLIATAGHAAGARSVPVWRRAGRAGLYGLRLLVALPSTVGGLRLLLLAATPLPVPPPEPVEPFRPGSGPVPAPSVPLAPPARKELVPSRTPVPVKAVAPEPGTARKAPAKPRGTGASGTGHTVGGRKVALQDVGNLLPRAREVCDEHRAETGRDPSGEKLGKAMGIHKATALALLRVLRAEREQADEEMAQ